MPNSPEKCRQDLIALYVDGELEPATALELENHLDQCRTCAAELRLQRQLMCELDSLMAAPLTLDVPQNFAQVVAVQAKSDMTGTRTRRERKRAIVFCLLLAMIASALLGATAGRSLLASVEMLGMKLIVVTSLLGKALYDAVAGVSVILRVTSGVLLPDAFAVLVVLLLMLAVLLLTILITAYHRYPHRGLYE